jgi:hypothetical protein
MQRAIYWHWDLPYCTVWISAACYVSTCADVVAAITLQVLRRAAEHYNAQLAGRIDPEAELRIDYDQLRQQCEAAAADAAGKPAGG